VSEFRRGVLRLALVGGAMFGCTGTRPADLGLRNGVLRPCPGTPNCVSSETGTPSKFLVKAFPAPAGAEDLTRLAELVAAWPRTAIVVSQPGYMHVEFTSLLMRFVDDVEFRYDAAASVIHVRSASRLGESDLGVNRKRVEALRDKWDPTVDEAVPGR
jgi:uncharacterized protein (DUF1499 family)